MPYTFNVLVPYTTAELTVKYPTFMVAMFAVVAKRFVVVTELDTTKFANGWVIARLEIFESKPPSP